ncbi:MAG: hypothetical protein ACFFCX_17895, partial [Candidatus Sifarchaeia archaeon]
RRLYFEKGLSQKTVAKKLGLRGTSPVRRIFKERGWKTRGRWNSGATYGRPRFETKEEREMAKKRRNRNSQKRLKKLRENLFGTECKICGISSREKSIVIHRKDFKDHKSNILWLKGSLQSLEPDNWVALCVYCHRMVHWLNSNFNSNWQDIEKYLDRKKSQNTQNKKLFSVSSGKGISNKYKEIAEKANGDVRELRKLLFGNECYFCKDSNDKRRLVIHRKDGKSHNRILWQENKLKYLNPDEWVVLCQKCHRYVHWAEEKLGLMWKDLKK